MPFYWGREKLEEVLARFEKFGLPIHFTENTLVSGPLIPPHCLKNIRPLPHTQETVKTDANGSVTVKGFKGKYIAETLNGEKVMEFKI